MKPVIAAILPIFACLAVAAFAPAGAQTDITGARIDEFPYKRLCAAARLSHKAAGYTVSELCLCYRDHCRGGVRAGDRYYPHRH